MRQLVSPREVSDWVLSTQHSHHLDARVPACTHAHKLVLQGQRQPCCSPLQAYLQAQIRWQAGPRRLQAGVERPHCPLPPPGGLRTRQSRRQKERQAGFGLWPSAASPAPPPPGQPSAGERQSQNERPVRLVYLQPDAAAQAGVHACLCLTVVTLLKGGRKGVWRIRWPPAVCPQSPFRLVRNQQRSKAISPWKVKMDTINSGISAVTLS